MDDDEFKAKLEKIFDARRMRHIEVYWAKDRLFHYGTKLRHESTLSFRTVTSNAGLTITFIDDDVFKIATFYPSHLIVEEESYISKAALEKLMDWVDEFIILPRRLETL